MRLDTALVNPLLPRLCTMRWAKPRIGEQRRRL